MNKNYENNVANHCVTDLIIPNLITDVISNNSYIGDIRFEHQGLQWSLLINIVDYWLSPEYQHIVFQFDDSSNRYKVDDTGSKLELIEDIPIVQNDESDIATQDMQYMNDQGDQIVSGMVNNQIQDNSHIHKQHHHHGENHNRDAQHSNNKHQGQIYSVKILKDSVINNHAGGIAASSAKHIEKQNIAKQEGQEYLVNLHNSSKIINYNQLNKAIVMLNNSKPGELKVKASNNDLLFVASSNNHTLRIKNWPSDEKNNSPNRIIKLKFDQLSPSIEVSAISKLKLSKIAKIQNLVSKAELSYEITKKLEQLDAKVVNELKYLLVSSHKVGLTNNNHCLGFKSP